MAINRDKVDLWKKDVEESVDFFNSWFLSFAPRTFKTARNKACEQVDAVFEATNDVREITAPLLAMAPTMVSTLRQMTCPPLARDRLAGLARLSSTIVKSFEEGKIPTSKTGRYLPFAESISSVVQKLLDDDLFPWRRLKAKPTEEQRRRSALVVADRLCGSLSDPIIRNEQERRQLTSIRTFLEQHGYRLVRPSLYEKMKPGEFAFHLNIPVKVAEGNEKKVNIPIDVAILPMCAKQGDLPVLLEAKSAGDFTNVNKRRKEEAQKIQQLNLTYGPARVDFVLFLCGYFDSGYLGYEAAEGIDWVWEHRIEDMERIGL